MGGDAVHGWDLLQKTKMARETEHIPVIVCTAAAGAVPQHEGWLASKGVKIVLKPFSVDDLELAINKALALPGMVPAPGGTGDATDPRNAN